MMNFMRDGGFNMWLLVFIAVGTVALAMTRARSARPAVFVTGTLATLISGMFGMAAGMKAVAQNVGRFPDPGAATAVGLGELANNGILAAMIAVALGIGALVSARAVSAE